MRNWQPQDWLMVLAVVLSGCASTKGRPFDNCSADFNEGRLHRLQTPGDLESVADAVVTIMESSGASLVRRRTTKRDSLVLSFRIAVERLARTRSSSTGIYSAPSRWFRTGLFSANTITSAEYVAYGALFYVELTAIPGGVELQGVGLPVVDGVTACPAVVSPYRECQPARPTGEESFAEHVGHRSKLSVTGAKEAEVLTGLLGQLQRKTWQQRFKASSSGPPPQENKAVDDAF
jgi:hypothetical protein